MAQVLFDSGVFKVTIKHLWQKREGGVFYYRRRYPEHYRELMRKQGKELPIYKTVSLQTQSKVEAAKQIATHARADDREWAAFSGGLPSAAVKADAFTLIRSRGLIPAPLSEQPNPEQAELAWDFFCDELEQRIRNETREEEHNPFEDVDLADHLTPVELAAVDIVAGRYKPHLSDAKDYYLKTRSTDRKVQNATDAAFRMITDVIGDKPLDEYKRAEVAEAINSALDSGLKTGSVERRLGTVKAAVSELIRDNELDIKNPFEKHRIKGKGEDVEERSSLNQEQMVKLRSYIRSHTTPTANMLGLIIDTGARVKEVAGLMREDVKLADTVPHVVIHANPMRRLKTKNSRRMDPLVGEALMAAQRALNDSHGLYLFPRYMSDVGVKNESASAAMRKVTQALDCHTPHWLRHTMRTRLRNVNAAEPIVNEIGGWARVSVSQSYGTQTALKVMQEVLEKSLSAPLE